MTRLQYDQLGKPIQALQSGVTQRISIGGASAASSAFAAKTRAVRIVSTTACHYVVGSDPTATTDDTYLPAEVVEFVAVGGGQKIAFIQAASAGTAWITEAD